MSKLHDLADLGQSIWLDYIRRDLLDSDELNQLHQTGVRGVTSNPSIFQKAIANSDDYDDDLEILIAENKSAKEIYEILAIADIQRACDVFMDLYRQTEGHDGYVSLEANPRLAYKTEETIAEARRLFAAVDRPNVYIKVPATPEGIPAIRQLISEGINVNVTLIFAISAYEDVAEAYLSGLEALAASGGDLSSVSSVASFFVSRVDTKADKALAAAGNESLLGTIGIANAKMAYQRFKEIFSGPRWRKLAEQGARLQRPLWGSTSTKNPAYPDTLYVDNLIGPHTVNTVPPETLEAILDHATVERTIDKDVDLARRQLQELEALGISLDQITDELLEEGVEKFAASFISLLETIEERKRQEKDGLGRTRWEFALTDVVEDEVNETLDRLEENDFLERLWQKDYTLWSDAPTEISNRLGWLDLARAMEEEVARLRKFANGLVEEDFREAILLGMGGSSLAPELFAQTFGTRDGHLQLSVLDSTDPSAIRAVRDRLDAERTLFIVSSKSGSTVETISLSKYFYNWMSEAVEGQSVGDHFIAITDAGSKLEALARKLNFRAVFLSDPNVGGRYSALSHFGLVPAALAGVDLRELLARAQQIHSADDAVDAMHLGAVMGTMALSGRDKMTLIISPEIASFGNWVEQLIAESTGKAGKGILPVVGEPLMAPDHYNHDRLFVFMLLDGAPGIDETIEPISQAGHPVVTITVPDRYALGEQFVAWEVATAVAGHVLGIQPFNQPNVESAKKRAGEMLAIYKSRGQLPGNVSRLKGVGGIEVQELVLPADTPVEALENFLDGASPEGYVAVQAYVAPTVDTDHALARFRAYINDQTGLAVTVGYGPRFLHSTGQLHKGDAGNGSFIQLVSEPLADIPIPEEAGHPESAVTFGVLKVAQALGDARALRDANRRVIRFSFGEEPKHAIALLMQET